MRVVRSLFPGDQCFHRALLSRVDNHEETAAYSHALRTVHAVAYQGGNGPIDSGTSISNDIPERKLNNHPRIGQSSEDADFDIVLHPHFGTRLRVGGYPGCGVVAQDAGTRLRLGTRLP